MKLVPTSAPTVAVESLFLSTVIDAKECRDVVTCDILGEFMQADGRYCIQEAFGTVSKFTYKSK